MINSEAAQVLNLQSTEESLVLLKNEKETLPLKPGLRLAVIGPLANLSYPMLGTHFKGGACPDDASSPDEKLVGAAQPSSPDGNLACIPTPYAALAAINNAAQGGSTTYVQGTGITGGSDGIPQAVEAAGNADRIVLVLGITSAEETEQNDRTSIDLPAVQHQLALQIIALGKPVIVVLINGGMVAIEAEAAATGPVAIIEALLPSSRGGEAIANGIFGKHGFGGRLPYTVYKAGFVNETKMSEMELTAGVGRTYRYYAGKVTYPFAHGLSLTPATLSAFPSPPPPAAASAAASAPPSSPALASASASASSQTTLLHLQAGGSETQTVQVTVAAGASPAGASAQIPVSQVVTAFWRPTAGMAASGVIAAKTQLFNYDRIVVPPHGKGVLTFSISSNDFQVAVQKTGDIAIYPGTYAVDFTDGAGGVATVHVEIAGDDVVVVERFPTP